MRNLQYQCIAIVYLVILSMLLLSKVLIAAPDEASGYTVTLSLSSLKKMDRRKQKTKKSPAYLDAVGKINVLLTKDAELLRCSGTLIAAMPGEASRVIKSAGHCFGSTKTLKKYPIHKITWQVNTQSGESIELPLTLEYLSLEQDSALLSLEAKIPFMTIKPALVIKPNQGDKAFEQVKFLISVNPEYKLISAGFSADTHKGKNGDILTFDDVLNVKHINDESAKEYDFSIRTVSYTGASGGACLLHSDLTKSGINNPHRQVIYLGTTLTIRGDNGLYRNRLDGIMGSPLTFYNSFNEIDFEQVNNLNRHSVTD
ncbi:hypothetical protein [Shewanella acanthi]|uniref:hypothetical protein n=1 Tax=Shewanella acanthi TaxID=2864212 RepID=UPI001C65C551|nr:hypothetical protein [Shewanella acanthi]QYJ77374.1 hypothetical protein K0H61_09380 [Shewanella acanthi]